MPEQRGVFTAFGVFENAEAMKFHYETVLPKLAQENGFLSAMVAEEKRYTMPVCGLSIEGLFTTKAVQKFYVGLPWDAAWQQETAEQNAKNAIIEAVTPRIRSFIEDQLLRGAPSRNSPT